MFKLQKYALLVLLASSAAGQMNVNLSCPSMPRLTSPVNVIQVLWQSYDMLFRSPKPADGVRLLFFTSKPQKNFSIFKLVFEVKTASARFNQYYLALEAVYSNNEYSISRFLQTTDLVEAQRIIRVGTIDLYKGYVCDNLRDAFMKYKGLVDHTTGKDTTTESRNDNDLEFEKLLTFELDDSLKGADTYNAQIKEEPADKSSTALSKAELLTITNKKGPNNAGQLQPESSKSSSPLLPIAEKSAPQPKLPEQKNSVSANQPRTSTAEQEIDELLGMIDDIEPTTRTTPKTIESKPQNVLLTKNQIIKNIEKSTKESNKIQASALDVPKISQPTIADFTSTNSRQGPQPQNIRSADGIFKSTRGEAENPPINAVTQKKSLNIENIADDEIVERTNDTDTRTVRTTSTKTADRTQADTVVTGSVSSLNNTNQNLQLLKLLTNLGLLGGEGNENLQNINPNANDFAVRGTNTNIDSLRVRNRGTVQENLRTPERTLNLQGGNDPMFLRYYNQGFANSNLQNYSNIPIRGIRAVN